MSSVKMSLKHYREFYNDPSIWEINGYQGEIESDVLVFRGKEYSDLDEPFEHDDQSFEDHEIVTVTEGTILYPLGNIDDMDLVKTIKKWLKQKREKETHLKINLKIPKEKEKELRELIKKIKGEVVSCQGL